MKIAVCETMAGVGNTLVNRLQYEGCEVVCVEQKDMMLGVAHLQQFFCDADAVINLCGDKMLRRWNYRQKERIYNSRIENTRLIVRAVNGMKQPPSLFITFTMTNIYDEIEVHDEFSQNFATDFLGDMCRLWEHEIFRIKPEIRFCILRSGYILSRNEGLFPKAVRLCKWGFSLKTGKGKQPVPFIHIDDMLNVVMSCINNPNMTGIYNLVAPQIVTNAELSAILLKTLKRMAVFRIGSPVLRLFLSEAAAVVKSGQFVLPQRLLADGFEFMYPTLKEGLKNLVKD
ncbi:MAG: TIGR01777 family oxidoreductase [Cytophagaceae bacterium]|jgi:uncharacterized protein (TIGR01777 family)|nr:TIGR01777 family oxidoreductase [Cytophagaceae bacterium]